jgi:PAS domain-containing protein
MLKRDCKGTFEIYRKNDHDKTKGELMKELGAWAQQAACLEAGVHIQDITERKWAEEKLRESEESFRRVFQEGPLGMCIATPDFHFTKVNDAFCRMLGYSSHELALLTFKDITHPEHLTQDIESANKLITGEIPVYRTEKRYH